MIGIWIVALLALVYLLFALVILLPALVGGAPSSTTGGRKDFEEAPHLTGRVADLQTGAIRAPAPTPRDVLETAPPISAPAAPDRGDKFLKEADEKIRMLQFLLETARTTQTGEPGQGDSSPAAAVVAENAPRRIEPDPRTANTQLSVQTVRDMARRQGAGAAVPTNAAPDGNAVQRRKKALDLFRKGLSKEEVARETSMGMAEIDLIIAMENRRAGN